MDGEIGRDHTHPQDAATNEADGIVGGAADNAAMDKSVLLLQLVRDPESQFGAALGE